MCGLLASYRLDNVAWLRAQALGSGHDGIQFCLFGAG